MRDLVFPIADLAARFAYDPATGHITSLLSGRRIGFPQGGYECVAYKRKNIKSHRLGWALYHGEFPDFDLDHRDLCRTNNRIGNLRPATSQQNSANVTHKSNKLGAKGVRLHENGKYRASIMVERKHVHLGYFDTLEEATRAYDCAALQHFGEYARPSIAAEVKATDEQQVALFGLISEQLATEASV